MEQSSEQVVFPSFFELVVEHNNHSSMSSLGTLSSCDEDDDDEVVILEKPAAAKRRSSVQEMKISCPATPLQQQRSFPRRPNSLGNTKLRSMARNRRFNGMLISPAGRRPCPQLKTEGDAAAAEESLLNLLAQRPRRGDFGNASCSSRTMQLPRQLERSSCLLNFDLDDDDESSKEQEQCATKRLPPRPNSMGHAMVAAVERQRRYGGLVSSTTSRRGAPRSRGVPRSETRSAGKPLAPRRSRPGSLNLGSSQDVAAELLKGGSSSDNVATEQGCMDASKQTSSSPTAVMDISCTSAALRHSRRKRFLPSRQSTNNSGKTETTAESNSSSTMDGSSRWEVSISATPSLDDIAPCPQRQLSRDLPPRLLSMDKPSIKPMRQVSTGGVF